MAQEAAVTALACPCGTGSCPSCVELERAAVRRRITWRLADFTVDELRQVETLVDMIHDERRALEAVDPRTPGAGL